MNLLRLARQAGKTTLLTQYVKRAIENEKPAILVVHNAAEVARIIHENPELNGFVYSFSDIVNNPNKRMALRDNHVEIYVDNIDLILTELFGKAPHIMSSSL